MKSGGKVGGNFLRKVAVLGGQCVRHFFATTLQGPCAHGFKPKVRFFQSAALPTELPGRADENYSRVKSRDGGLSGQSVVALVARHIHAQLLEFAVQMRAF